MEAFDGMIVCQAAAGSAHSVALTGDGQVHTWGYGWFGQLGLGDTLSHSSPQLVVFGEEHNAGTIAHVAAGADHSVVTTGTSFNRYPLPFPSLPFPSSLLISAHGCVCRTDEGRVFSWGNCRHGQLGIGIERNSNTPVSVQELRGTFVSMVWAGRDHSLALSDTGSLFAWGRGLNGQLGNDATSNALWPCQVQFPAEYVRVLACRGSAVWLCCVYKLR